MAAALKDDMSRDMPLIVHWDGKLLADLSRKDHVGCLLMIVTGYHVFQLLKVSKTSGGSGENQLSVVVQALKERNLPNHVVGMCFDTTSSNTGINVGALIEQKLEKDLLHFTCHHHIMELLAGATFTVSLSSTMNQKF